MAQYSAIKEDSVVLITEEPREISVKLADLSLADRQHLVEYADQPKDILTSVEIGVPEEDVRIDKKQFKDLDLPLCLVPDSEDLCFKLMETDHFLIATAGKARPDAIAETAERLWYGMAFQHMNFRQDWGDEKFVIFVIEDEEIYEALGKWNVEYLESAGLDGAALQSASSWNRVGATQILLPSEVQKEYGVVRNARVLRVRDQTSRSFRKVFGPFMTNAIASSLITKQMGGQSGLSAPGYFALTTGHSYFKELQLAGRSETTLLAPAEYDSDEIGQTRGFSDGTSWSKSLRKMVKDGEVEIDLARTLGYQNGGDLTPTKLVTIYALSYYLNSNAARVSSMAELMRRIESGNQIPEAIEIAKLFDFESVEEFNASWKEFVLSREFK